MAKRKTNELFLQQLKTVSPTIEPLEKYVGNHDNIRCRCLVCGNEWNPTPGNLLHGYGCPKCGKIKQKKKATMSEATFLDRLHKINPDIEVKGSFVNTNTRIEVECKKCHHVWNPLSSQLLQGHGCSKCAKKRSAAIRRTSREDFVAIVAKKSPTIEVLGEYINSKTGILCKCKNCGHTWEANPDRLMSGQGCRECNNQSTSFIEQVILETLSRAFPSEKIVSRDRKTIGSELDIYIPNQKLAVEYGAYYWHRNKINKDREKEKKCYDLGIRLIRIYDKADEDFSDSENCLIYTKDLSQKPEYLYEMIKSLFNLIGVSYNGLKKEFDDIKDIAYMRSRKKTTDEFVKEMKAINPNVEILGEFKKSNERIKVRCKVCGNEWNPTPHQLMTGYGCRECYLKSKPTTQEEFERKVKTHNPNIEVVGKYTTAGERIKCRCVICGHSWDPFAKNILKYGCPECAKKRERQVAFGHVKKTHEQFLEEVNKNNPMVEVLGHYQGSHKPVLCRCKVCGNEWNPSAYNVSKGYGCRKCAGKRHSQWMKDNHITPQRKRT